jgi:hypothetical protein
MIAKLLAIGLVVAVLLAGAKAEPWHVSGQTPTPTSRPATPGPAPTGSISGRVYVDLNGNGLFDPPYAPLEFPLDLFLLDVSGPPFTSLKSSGDGTYVFHNLPPGNYALMINLPISSCAVPINPIYVGGGHVFRHILSGPAADDPL